MIQFSSLPSPQKRCKLICVVILIIRLKIIDSSVIEEYDQRPKILARDGDLIFTPASERNIRFIAAEGGTIYLNDDDLLQLSNTLREAAATINAIKGGLLADISDRISNLEAIVTGTQGIANRLTQIEQSIANGTSSMDMPGNVDTKLKTLFSKVMRLTQIIGKIRTSLNTNECSSNPCRNGGTCEDSYNSFICRCPPNWEGTLCEVDVNECAHFAGTDLGCQNGATCVNRIGTYECQCASGFYGQDCTRRDKECSKNNRLCDNGICINQEGTTEGYTCLCNQGYTKPPNSNTCIDVDECNSGKPVCSMNPLVTCINLPGSFHCGPCPQGYTGNGFYCVDIDECQINNGGCSINPTVQCTNIQGSRICGPCPPGYQGDGTICNYVGVCRVNNGGCHPLARCVDNPAISQSYVQCICPMGYIGSGIGPSGCVAALPGPNTGGQTPCQPNPCIHGTCSVSGNSFVCHCISGFTGPTCNLQQDPCSSTPCQNGGTCMSQGLGYYCRCPSTSTGMHCEQQQMSCGGILRSEAGILKFPESGSRSDYPASMSCGWQIFTNETQVLNVSVTRFNLEDSPGCTYDWLQIHDGPSSTYQSKGRFCGTTVLRNFTTTHNSLYLWFRSDNSNQNEGFELTWTSIDPVCGGRINFQSHGSLSSPGYPAKYPINRDCEWALKAPYGKRILFHFYTMNIENHANCSFDYVEIRNGFNNQILKKFCNTSSPEPLTTPNSRARVIFHSDGVGRDTGFQVSFSATQGADCGGVLTRTSGTIVPPIDPETNKYMHRVTCEWVIQYPEEQRINIQFLKMSLETHHGCAYDNVQVYEGKGPSASLVDKHCGNKIPRSYTSNGNVLTIIFTSDSSYAYDGFVIKYKEVCGGIFSVESGHITSPMYPNRYPNNKDCIYELRQALGTSITLNFYSFALENRSRYSSVCYDYVEIRDGHSENSPLRGNYCGTQFPPTIVSTHNYLWIKFHTDSSDQFPGFYANYTTQDITCGGIIRETEGTIQTPQYPDVYQNNHICRWVIVAEEGNVINLNWINFHLEESNIFRGDCRYDFVEVYENITEGAAGVKVGNQKYCGHQSPPNMTSTSDIVTIIFKTDSSMTYPGFQVRFSQIQASHICSANFVSSTGTILSPGYPNQYPHNKDCSWVITVPNGQQILLNISDFNLETHPNCDWDYLEIRNGGYSSSPLIGKFCGTKVLPPIPSHSNQIFLRFVTDHSRSAKGFRITWDGTITGCGGVLSGKSGHIVSPNYPQQYSVNTECFYRITTSQGSKIQIVVLDFDMEMSHNCLYDYLAFYDGTDSNSKFLGRYCSENYPHVLLSSSNNLFVKFKSDASHHGRGFSIKYDTVCDVTLKGFGGVIESPNFPKPYPNNLNCRWTIEVRRGNFINITFSHFQLEQTCEDDYVRIREAIGDHVELTPIRSDMCGESVPDQINSNSNKVVIEMKTDSSVQLSGFRLEWYLHGCGGHFIEPSGEIKSPNYPNGYRDNTECEWLITVDLGKSIELTIEDFDVETSGSCRFDVLMVYGGPDEQSPKLTSGLCHQMQKPMVLTSSGNNMFITFTSDSSFVGRGFNMTYKTIDSVCGGTFKTPSGIINSHNFPQNYDPHDDCLWLIQVEENHVVQLDFVTFDMEPHENCSYDYVKLFDGNSTESPEITTLCGNNINVTSYKATGNTMMLRMKADGSSNYPGFQAKYTTVCGARITTDSYGIISLSTAINVNPGNGNCSWIILGSQLQDRITLTVTHMDISPSSDNAGDTCEFSYLEIYDGEDEDSTRIGPFCGSRIPPHFTSHGSALRLHLVSTHGVHYGFFSAAYSVLQGACGGNLTSETGAFTSPGYPETYPLNSECVWIISTSPGNRVTVGFRSFSLEQSENCNKDYLEVRETSSEGNLIGSYCSDLPTNITASQTLWIKFHSDTEGTEAGFIADYSLLHGNELSGSSGQIASPLYPRPYIQEGLFTWRITVDVGSAVRITFKEFYLESFESECMMYLAFYDGYDTTAPQLAKLCGTIIPEPFKSSSNVVFIEMNTHHRRSIFLLEWLQVERVPVPINTSMTSQDCGGTIYLGRDSNSTNSSNEFTFTSPGFPNGYGSRLNCEWIIQTPPLFHAVLVINVMDLEPSRRCTVDYLSVYDGALESDNWRLEKTLCFSNASSEPPVETSNLMKVVFKTDYSVNRTGFSAKVYSACGGSIKASSGVIETDNTTIGLHQQRNYYVECRWNITVRSWRTIRIVFDRFYIRPEGNTCSYRFLKLQNGHFPDSPTLGETKYCGNQLPVVPNTMSNHLAITYKNMRGGVGFKLRFYEVSESCGGSFNLDRYNSFMEISSPGFPNAPPPHTECIWSFMAPGGENLQVNFDSTFDFKYSEGCENDFIELRDGGTELARLINNRFCEHAPGTQRTTGNMVWIRYFTDSDSRQARFKANVSLAQCGGVIRHWNGQIHSPQYPRQYPSNTQCTWRIEVRQYNSISIHFKDLDLPSADNCATTDSVTIKEIRPYLLRSNVSGHLRTVCGSELPPVIEVASTTAIVEFKSLAAQQTEYKGFHLNFTISYRNCGGEVRNPSGRINTPGFPNGMQYLNCAWQIIVPKGRRVKIVILTKDLDFTEQHSSDLLFYNQQHPYFIDSLWRNRTIREIKSSGNIMHVYLYSWSNHLSRVFMVYSSDEPAECGGDLQGTAGSLELPQTSTRSFYCEWEYNAPPEINGTLAVVFQNITIGRYGTFYNCRYSGSKIRIAGADENELIFENCRNYTQSRVIVSPFPLTKIIAAQSIRAGLVTFTAQYSISACGGILTDIDETIISPGHPANYPPNTHCAWAVKFPDEKRISVHIDALELENNCENDYVIIHNGPLPTSPVIGRYCGTAIPKDFISQSNSLWIEFHSDSQSQFAGFKMTLSSISSSCGGILHGTNSIISSPGFPGSYPANAECEWEIRTEIGYYIQLQFIQRFQLEQSNDCANDFVEVFDYNNDEYRRISKLCGRDMPPVINSTSSQLRIRFKSNENIQGDGFKAQWTQKCGGLIENMTMGHIISPGYPNKYANTLNCNYTVNMPGDYINVEFDSFHLEAGSGSCKFDNVTIYRSQTWSSPQQLGPFCGINKPPPFIASGRFSLIFQTDYSVTNPGFLLRFRSITSCGGNITEPGRLVSPNVHMESFYVQVNCTWIIAAPENKVIVLRFSSFVLSAHMACFYSTYGVSLYEGAYVDSKHKVATYCGNLSGVLPVHQSSGNRMVVQYITDSHTKNNYFDADILFTYGESSGCGGIKNITQQITNIVSPDVNHDRFYESSLDCQWTLTTLPNQVISFEITNFEVTPCANVSANSTNYCGCDYLEVRDSGNRFGELIGIYCGQNRPGPIISSNNKLWIRFVTDEDGSNIGFNSNVRAIPSLCSAPLLNVTSSVQYLTSLNYPNNYPPNLRCNWLLKTSRPSDRIAIHIEDLNITNSDECTTSMLKITDNTVGHTISEITDQNIIVFGQATRTVSMDVFHPVSSYTFCKDVKNFNYYSINDKVILSFVSNELTSKGFNISYSIAGCSRNYTAPQGRIHIYGLRDSGCIMFVQTSPNRTISLYIGELHTSANCENSGLEIRDGLASDAPLLTTVCGYTISNPVFSTGNALRIQTRSMNFNNIYFNLDMTYTTTDKGRGCGGSIFNYAGIFTSPMYPANIRNASICRWDISVPVGNLVAMKFKEFQIGPSNTCSTDFVELIEIDGTDNSETIRSTYCGDDNPAVFVGSSNKFALRYTRSVHNGGTGWVAVFMATLPGQRIYDLTNTMSMGD